MSNRAIRVCKTCGKLFRGSGDRFYCPECAKLRKIDAVVKIRICQDCGVEFSGGPTARRCPDCAYKARLEDGRRHKKQGTARPIGSIDTCKVCGSQYTVMSGRQKYCSNGCMRKALLDKQREYKTAYNKMSGQDAKKRDNRASVKKVCSYCQRTFTSHTPVRFCSEYCRSEQNKLLQCIRDINRGKKRDLQKYEDKRREYREEVKAGKA